MIWQAELTQSERLAGVWGQRPHGGKRPRRGNSNRKMLPKAQEGSLIAEQSGAGDPSKGLPVAWPPAMPYTFRRRRKVGAIRESPLPIEAGGIVRPPTGHKS